MTEATPLHLGIIVGSTRVGRAADLVVPWVERHARAHGDDAFDVRVLDLRDFPMPMFGEGEWPTPEVTAWNAAVAACDAFVFLTPEYNHSTTGVLKNAIDATRGGFRNKPSGMVGYSGGPIGGARAVEHLAHMAIEAESVPLRNSVLLGMVGQAIVDGEATDRMSDLALTVLLEDLVWWGTALRTARQAGELEPGMVRRHRAMAAA